VTLARTGRASGIALAVLLSACGRPQSIPVDIKQFAYVPARVQAHEGDTLVFTNHDIVPHTATARDKAWDTGTIAPGETGRVVVNGAGEFLCTFHPTMTGRIDTE